MGMTFIDLFAGVGGFTEGATRAGGIGLWAANHWPLAVSMHAANHPGVTHVCQDLHQADWRALPDFDCLLAAPACQGHTPARGKEKPHHDALRSTAWAVVSCAEFHRPPVVVIENVTGFMKWLLYPSWLSSMHALGYAVRPYVIDAADHGAPQARVRLYLVCTQSRHPLELVLPRRDPVPVDQVIDWDAGVWHEISPARYCAATLARFENGRRSFGDRFVAPYYGSGSGKTGRSIQRPIGTIRTGDCWTVVKENKCRLLSIRETTRVMTFAESLVLPARRTDCMTMLGNAVVPLVADDLLSAIFAAV